MIDIEETLATWLAKIAGVPVFGSVPQTPPCTFLTVERTGGSSSFGIDRPALAVQIWAATKSEARRLAILVRDAATARLTEEVCCVTACNIDALSHFPDPDRRQERYQLAIDLVTYI